MMRRRQEREEIARLVGGHTDVSDDSLGEDIKREVFSLGDLILICSIIRLVGEIIKN